MKLTEKQIKSTKMGSREESIKYLTQGAGRDEYLDKNQSKMMARIDKEKEASQGGRRGGGTYDTEMAQRVKDYKSGVGIMETKREGGFESSAQKQGLAATPEQQAAYAEASGQRADEFALDGGGGGAGGGGGSVKVTISLAAGLQGAVDKAVGVMAEIENA
jgi:hypothetical protein